MVAVGNSPELSLASPNRPAGAVTKLELQLEEKDALIDRLRSMLTTMAEDQEVMRRLVHREGATSVADRLRTLQHCLNNANEELALKDAELSQQAQKLVALNRSLVDERKRTAELERRLDEAERRLLLPPAAASPVKAQPEGPGQPASAVPSAPATPPPSPGVVRPPPLSPVAFEANGLEASGRPLSPLASPVTSPDALHNRGGRASSEDLDGRSLGGSEDLGDLMFGFDAGGVLPDTQGAPMRGERPIGPLPARRWWFWGGRDHAGSAVLSV